MKQLKVGFLGTGGIAWNHIKGMSAQPGLFCVQAAADINEAGIKHFCKENAIPGAYTDYRRILDDPAIDAVVILLPHNLHEEACVTAFESGKHVLIEKPISRTLEETDHIIAAAKKAKRTLMVAHNQRYMPYHIKIKELIDAEYFGRLFCGRADHYQNVDRPSGHWWRSREAVGGGCVIGSGIHRLDLLRWFLGEAEQVFAYQVEDPERLEAEVACAATIKFRGGAIAEFFINWGAYLSGESLAIYGKHGSVSLRKHGDPLVLVNHREDPSNKPVEVNPPSTYDSMWTHFAKCIDSGAEPLTSGIEGRKSLALVLAINRSAERGTPVKL
jgi:predicted dehydrogenase